MSPAGAAKNISEDLVSLGSYAMAMLVTIAIIYAQLHVGHGSGWTNHDQSE